MKYILILLSSQLICLAMLAQPGKKPEGFAELEKRVEAKRVKALKADLKKKLLLLKTNSPLYIVDGIQLKNLKGVDTAAIDSIFLVQPKPALSRYGAAGKKGALEITMKKDPVKDSQKQEKGTIPNASFTDTPWPGAPPESRSPVVEQESDRIYTKTEIEPKYKLNWNDFIKKNLKYPADAMHEGIQGKVVIDFIVNMDGSIYDLRLAPTSPVKNPSLVMEAIRITKKTTGQWKPAMQNGREVKAYTQIELVFILPDEE